MLKKLALIARAEKALLKLRLRQVLAAFVCLCVALCFFLMGLLTSHVAAFVAIEQKWGSIWAGGLITLFDLLVAVSLTLFALSRSAGGAEKKLALEARDLTIESVQDDISQISEEIKGFRAELAQLRGLVSRAFGALSWSFSLGQFLIDLLKADSKAKGPAKASEQGAAHPTSKHSDSEES